jgi:pimeloyl-ACP methyl ester carboxylesterase
MMVASALSEPISRASLPLATVYVAPDGELETLIANLYAEVFGLDQVGANDEFFELGGDSLLAEVLSLRISERTRYNFRPSSLIEFGSPRRIGQLVGKRSPDIDLPNEDTRPPIFVVHGRGGFTLPAPAFVQALARGQKLRMFELPGIRDGQCLPRIEDIAAVYVAQLEEQYPQGPILLAAFCAGALIALEMAAQLANIGRPIQQLVLLDPPVRQGTLGVGQIGGRIRSHKDSAVKAMLRPLLPMRALCRYHELKYRTILRRKRHEGRLRYADYHFSFKAQAKLYVAFLLYRPRPYQGPVTIFSSGGRSRAFRGGTHLTNLLPEKHIELVTEGHNDMAASAAVARLMQTVFDESFRR